MLEKIGAFVGRVPWWGWVAIALTVLLLWSWASGGVGSLYRQVLDQLREDQSQVVTTLEQNLKTYEAEIGKLNDELAKVKSLQSVARAETERLKGVVREKDGEILALKKERETIVVSRDPNSLVNELHRMGYSTARYRSGR